MVFYHRQPMKLVDREEKVGKLVRACNVVRKSGDGMYVYERNICDW